jgi:DNA (cytosine-5)-methyltransferase 1
MSNQLMIRNIPPQIQRWLSEGRLNGVTKNERVLTALTDAYSRRQQPLQRSLFADDDLPQTDVRMDLPFKFIDLFAGIGGMRLGLSAVGGECVYTCEIDKHSRRTYTGWFGTEDIDEDVTQIDARKIPPHDILAAGFPCQPFSLAGVSKKKSLGRNHGFLDKTQGTLFFHLADIIETTRPPVVLLENVKNLRSHDKGKTWETIHGRLCELGYVVFSKVIDAADYVPQHRERIFIVGFRRSLFTKQVEDVFRFPDIPTGPRPQLKSILDDSPDKKYTLTDNLWSYLQKYAEKHRRKGNGFGFGIADTDGITRTLSARYYKDGSEILIAQEGKNPRRLSPQECQLLMGFPAHLKIQVSDMQAYRQFGNAVVPKVVECVASEILKVMRWQILRKKGNGCLLK